MLSACGSSALAPAAGTATPAAVGSTAPSVKSVAFSEIVATQRSGGYAVAATSIERRGDELLVHASFTEPAANGFVTQVITSPAYVVSIASTELTGAKTAVLLDASGTERARTSLP